MSASPEASRTQSERSAQTKTRLIEAAIASLIEHGYAHTTTVEICSRAELTRGAYNHHYASADALFVDVVEALYRRLAEPPSAAGADDSLEGIIRAGWSKVKRREFKAVIELWLASRNDAELGHSLGPAIARLSKLFEPSESPALKRLLGEHPERVGLYRLAFEAMIGLALGRATSPDGAAVQHEEQVFELLLSLAKETAP